MKKTLILTLLTLSVALQTFAGGKERLITPSATVTFAERDTCKLFMDIYQPAEGSDTAGKPTVMFVFGGGFITGTRDDNSYLPWFKDMTERGYRIVSIDYRLGLKGVKKVGLAQADLVMKAVQMAVEDAFSATAWLCSHCSDYGIDPANIVISGSSAGAITSLQCEYEICYGSEITGILPEGFNYSGIMSFSGGITNMGRAFTFKKAPCPILMLHGTADKIVNYNSTNFFSKGIFGSSSVVKLLERLGFNDRYWIVRFKGKMHEIAGSMPQTVDYQEAFIRHNVIDKLYTKLDALVEDPAIKPFKMSNRLTDLYK